MTADNTAGTTPPTLGTPQRVLVYRVIGVAVVLTSTGLTAWLGPRYPWLAGVNSALAWAVGKLLGIPLDEVVRSALAAMQPDRAAIVATDALKSLPPETAADVTRSLLRSIPPETAREVMGGVLTAPAPVGAARQKKTAPGD